MLNANNISPYQMSSGSGNYECNMDWIVLLQESPGGGQRLLPCCLSQKKIVRTNYHLSLVERLNGHLYIDIAISFIFNFSKKLKI